MIHTICACLFSAVIYLAWVPAAAARPVAQWSIAIKGGLFAPSLSDWERQYGTSKETISGLALGFKLSPRLEIGIEGSYFSADGKAVTASGRPSGTNQTFTLVQTQAYLIYQLAFYKDQMWVPYLGGGYSRFTYRTSLEGRETVRGAQEGYHLRVGLSLLLDRLDTGAALRAEDWGLVNSYFFIEAQSAKVDDFGDAAIDLGGWIYSGGLRYEF